MTGLMCYKRQNFENVRKYQAYLCAFCKNDSEDLPSGQNFEGLCDFIWNEYWRSDWKGKDDESDYFSDDMCNDGMCDGKGLNTKVLAKSLVPKCWLTHFYLVRLMLVVVQNVYRVVSLYILCTKTTVNQAYTFFVQNFPPRTTDSRPDFLKNHGRDSGRPVRDVFKIEAKTVPLIINMKTKNSQYSSS